MEAQGYQSDTNEAGASGVPPHKQVIRPGTSEAGDLPELNNGEPPLHQRGPQEQQPPYNDHQYYGAGGSFQVASNTHPLAGGYNTDVTTSNWKRRFVFLAVAQLVLGGVMFGLDIVQCTIALVANLYCYFSGVYVGICFIVTGIFGVLASSRNSKCLLITTIILSSVSALLATCANITSYTLEMQNNYYRTSKNAFTFWQIVTGINSILIIITMAQILISITHSVLSVGIFVDHFSNDSTTLNRQQYPYTFNQMASMQQYGGGQTNQGYEGTYQPQSGQQYGGQQYGAFARSGAFQGPAMVGPMGRSGQEQGFNTHQQFMRPAQQQQQMPQPFVINNNPRFHPKQSPNVPNYQLPQNDDNYNNPKMKQQFY